MSSEDLDILLVEDNQDDLDLTLHTLRHENLANKIQIVRDGEEASTFCLPRQVCRSIVRSSTEAGHAGFETSESRWHGSAQTGQSRPADQDHPDCRHDLVRKKKRDLVASYNLGANSYIQKPVDFEQFRGTVKTIGLYWLVINQPPVAQDSPPIAGTTLAGTNLAGTTAGTKNDRR